MISWTWIITIASLIGTILNIKKNNACFIIWLFTNTLWTIIDYEAGLYSQATLQLVYVGLALWGIKEWKKK